MKNALLAVLALALLGLLAFVLIPVPDSLPTESEEVGADAGVSAAGAPAGAAAGASDTVADRSEVEAGAAGSVPGASASLAFDGPAAQVTARLVDGSGAPAARSEARFRRDAASAADWMALPEPSAAPDEWPAVAPDRDGFLRVAVPAGVELGVDFGGERWRTQRRELQPLRAGETADLGEIALTSATLLLGRVRGADGAPLPGAEVSLLGADAGDFGGFRQLQETVADAEGRVRFPGVPSGRVRLEAQAARHASALIEALEIAGDGGEQSFELRLERGGEVSGHVVDADRRPLAGAEIFLIELRENQFAWGDWLPAFPDRDPDAVSAADGSFTVAGLPAADDGRRARTLLLARAEGIGTGAARRFRIGDEVSIVIPRGVRVAGQVVDEAGAPLAARVTLHQETPWGWREQKSAVQSAADGSFALPPMPPGKYEIEADAPVGSAAALALDLLRDTSELRLVIAREPVLSVLVTSPEGVPVAGAQVEIHTPGGRGAGQTLVMDDSGELSGTSGPSIQWNGSQKTGADGRALFRNAAATELALQVSAPGWARHHGRLLGTGADQEETVVLCAPGALRVTATDGAGQPVRGVAVVVRDPQTEDRALRETTDHLGRAWWDDLAPGIWQVEHEAEDGLDVGFDELMVWSSIGGETAEPPAPPDGASVRVRTGEVTEHGIVLDDLAVLTVKVTRGGGAPAPDVAVRLQRATEGDEWGGWGGGDPSGARTDARGLVVLAPVAAGEWDLIAKSGRNAPETKARLVLHGGAQTHELRLEGAEVRGALRDLAGPLAGARVSLAPYVPAGEGDSRSSFAVISMVGTDGGFTLEFGDGSGSSSASTGADGEYLFQDVPPGQWVLRARARGLAPWTSLPFPVADGAPVRVPEQVMLPGGVLHGHDDNWTGPRENSAAFDFDWGTSIRVEDASGKLAGMCRADEHGDWRVEDLAEGEYVVIRGGWRSEPIRLSAGETRRLDVPKAAPREREDG